MKNVFDVVIVGAGISGLAAARECSQNGLKVLVLEARDRLGGRIHTDRSKGFPVELGAGWLHDFVHNPVAAAAERFKLETLSFSTFLEDPDEHTIYGGDYNKLDPIQKKKFISYVNGFFETLAQENFTVDPAQFFTNFTDAHCLAQENKQFKQWLYRGLSCWMGTEFPNINSEVWATINEDARQVYVTNGYDHVIEELAKNLDIRLQSPVTQVKWNSSSGNVEVVAANQIFLASKIIISVPIGVLKRNKIEFIPPLPKTKKQAIDAIGLAVLNKAVLFFEECFWEKDQLTFHLLPSEHEEATFYVNHYPLLKQPVLVAFCGGELAKASEGWSEFQQKKSFTGPLQKIYQKKFKEPEKILTTAWFKDPYASCSYTYLPHGISSDMFLQLAKPVEDTLFFAGEATHPLRYASVHGAYESGLRAAAEVGRSL